MIGAGRRRGAFDVHLQIQGARAAVCLGLWHALTNCGNGGGFSIAPSLVLLFFHLLLIHDLKPPLPLTPTASNPNYPAPPPLCRLQLDHGLAFMREDLPILSLSPTIPIPSLPLTPTASNPNRPALPARSLSMTLQLSWGRRRPSSIHTTSPPSPASYPRLPAGPTYW